MSWFLKVYGVGFCVVVEGVLCRGCSGSKGVEGRRELGKLVGVLVF